MSWTRAMTEAALLTAVIVVTGEDRARGYDWIWTHDANGSGTAQIFDGGGPVSASGSTTSPSDPAMWFYAADSTGAGTDQTSFSVDGESQVTISPIELQLHVDLDVIYGENSLMPLGGTGEATISSTFEFVMPLEQLTWAYNLLEILNEPPLSMGAGVTVENVTQGVQLLSLSTERDRQTTLNADIGDLIRVTVFMTGGGTADGGGGMRQAVWWFTTSFALPDCNGNGLPDFEDVVSGWSPDCNVNGVPDECDTGEGTSEDCNFDSVPDECQPDEDCNTNSIRDICDIGAGTSPDCNNNLVPDECDDCNSNSIPDVQDIADETSTDCDLNCVPDDCEFVDCNTNTFYDGCDISEGTSFDLNENGVPDECDPLFPPDLPVLEEHQARKNRYISINPGMNGANAVALKVTLSSMMRCTADDTWSCVTDDDCPGICSGDNERSCWTDSYCEYLGAGFCVHDPCIEHGDVGLSWWVQQPEQNPNGCIPACGDEDWYARVDPDNMLFRVWTLNTLHIGDCEIIPVATYEVRACLPPDGAICSDPLIIGTIHKPGWGHYADVAGRQDDDRRWTPPDGFLNLTEEYAYVMTKWWSGTDEPAVAHPTWVDLTGIGSAPQYVLNAADFLQIERAQNDAYTYTQSPVNRWPGECNAVCANGRCDIDENPCNCEQDCGGPPTVEGNCDDSIDNDCDTAIDCADEDCAADAACTAPRERVIEWVPVDPPARGGNAVAVPVGSQVRLHLMVSGWDPNRDGDPKLGAVQAKLDSSGLSSGGGAPLNPLGYPGSARDGAFMVFEVCASDEADPGGTFDPLSRCNRDEDCPPAHPFCVERPDKVYYGVHPFPVVSTATLDYSWEAVARDAGDCDLDDGESKYAGTLILEAPAGAAGTYTIGFNEHPDQALLTDCDGAYIPDLTLRSARITVCEEAVSPPALPADPKHQAPKNRYLSFSPGNDCPYALAYQVSLMSMKRCTGDVRRACVTDGDCPGVCQNNNDLQCTGDEMCGTEGPCAPTGPCIEHSSVGTVTKWVGEPFEATCFPLDDCVGQSFANLSDTAVYRVWTEEVVHLSDCEVVPVAIYQVRATIDGVTFTEPLTIPTIAKPQVHYADCVGPVVADRFTAPDGFVSVLDIQAFLIAVQGGPTAPHTTWVDLHGVLLCDPPLGGCIVPQQILGVSDLQTIKFGFLGQTYVETPGHENPGDCP